MIRRAIVVGGGIGGLSCALALRKVGCEVVVVEQRTAGAAAGSGLGLWSPALAVLAQLGVLEPLVARTAPLGGLAVWTARGRLLRKLADPPPGPIAPRVAERGALLSTLRDAVVRDAGIELREGTRVVSFRDEADRVVAGVEGGAELAGELLVAADGVHSLFAAALGAPPLRYSGRTSFRGLAVGVASTLPSAASEVWDLGRRIGTFDLGDGRVYFYLAHNAPAGTDVPPPTRRAHLETLTAGWPAHVAAILAATPSDAIIHTDLHARPPFRGWSRGRIVLVGDAAHPMTPDLGNGACQAIEDAGSLAHWLATTLSLPAALDAYERHRYPRVAAIQRASWRTGWVRHFDNPLLAGLRNFFVAFTPGLGWVASKTTGRMPPLLSLPPV